MTYGNIWEIRPAGDMSEIAKASEQRRQDAAAAPGPDTDEVTFSLRKFDGV
jgi:hypothetical protein